MMNSKEKKIDEKILLQAASVLEFHVKDRSERGLLAIEGEKALQAIKEILFDEDPPARPSGVAQAAAGVADFHGNLLKAQKDLSKKLRETFGVRADLLRDGVFHNSDHSEIKDGDVLYWKVRTDHNEEIIKTRDQQIQALSEKYCELTEENAELLRIAEEKNAVNLQIKKNLTDQLNHKINQNSSMYEDNRDLRKSTISLKEQLKRTESAHQNLMSVHGLNLTENCKLEEKNKELKEGEQLLKTATLALQEACYERDEQIKQLKAQYAISAGELAILKIEFKEYKDSDPEFSELSEQYHELEAKNKELKKDLNGVLRVIGVRFGYVGIPRDVDLLNTIDKHLEKQKAAEEKSKAYLDFNDDKLQKACKLLECSPAHFLDTIKRNNHDLKSNRKELHEVFDELREVLKDEKNCDGWKLTAIVARIMQERNNLREDMQVIGKTHRIMESIRMD